MSMVDTHPVQAAFAAMIQTIEGDTDLRGSLTRVWSYFAPRQGSVDPNKVTIYATVEDSEGEQPSHSNAGESITSFLPTRFVLICDTQLVDDAGAFIGSGSASSLLDLEAKVIAALQSVSLWDVPQYVAGWTIAGIQRDVAVIDANGDIDPQVRRFEIALTVRVIIERTDLGI